jgi:hypothetical protein
MVGIYEAAPPSVAAAEDDCRSEVGGLNDLGEASQHHSQVRVTFALDQASGK